MSKTLLAGLVAFVVGGVTLGCVPEVPANPTYSNDVAAILGAHCVRCHGANDMLNAMFVYNRVQPPTTCYFQRYEDEGDCSVAGMCKAGAGNIACAPAIVTYIDSDRSSVSAMPPLPSEPLNDWEKEVLKRWAAHGAPK